MPHDRITTGGLTWDFVRVTGVPQLPRWGLKTIKAPGVDGKAFKRMSRAGAVRKLVLEAAALNLADEEDWIASMAALVGLQVTVWSSTGVSYSNWVVTEMTHLESVAVAQGRWGTASLGSTGRLLMFELMVEYPFGSA